MSTIQIMVVKCAAPKKRNKKPPSLRKVDKEKERGLSRKIFCYCQQRFLTFGKSELVYIHWYQFWGVKFPLKVQNL